MSCIYMRAHCNGVKAAMMMPVGNCYVRFRRQTLTLEWPPKRFYVMRVNDALCSTVSGRMD
jgi:hypothetical protein